MDSTGAVKTLDKAPLTPHYLGAYKGTSHFSQSYSEGVYMTLRVPNVGRRGRPNQVSRAALET